MPSKPKETIEGADAIFSAHLALPPITCERIEHAVDAVLQARCSKKKNHLEHCKGRNPTARVAAVTAAGTP
jgi:hypothetical protein